jgi:hypothetical protein
MEVFLRWAAGQVLYWLLPIAATAALGLAWKSVKKTGTKLDDIALHWAVAKWIDLEMKGKGLNGWERWDLLVKKAETLGINADRLSRLEVRIATKAQEWLNEQKSLQQIGTPPET